MGWPCRRELWGPLIEQARHDYAAVAAAISAFEPVTMIANPGEDARGARAALPGSVEVTELPLDDSWLRDCGPIYVRGEDGRRAAVHFRFNGWGEKFSPYAADAAVGRLIAEHLGDEVSEVPFVLEGGSILSDGDGLLLTTEQCLLHPSRNPTLGRVGIEQELRASLGVKRLVWLGQGLLEDRDTDGHVDLIAAFTAPGEVLLQTVGPENPNSERCRDNLARLHVERLVVHELPFLPYVEVGGERVAVSYLNLYICNGGVIVPRTGAPTDDEALSIIQRALPDREVVGVPGAVLAYGGGGPHCITQQVPVRNE
jgi:agmatine deiminase